MTEAGIAQSYKRARAFALVLGVSAVVLLVTVMMLIWNAVSRLLGTPGAPGLFRPCRCSIRFLIDEFNRRQ